jgi:hypothetical protein
LMTRSKMSPSSRKPFEWVERDDTLFAFLWIIIQSLILFLIPASYTSRWSGSQCPLRRYRQLYSVDCSSLGVQPHLHAQRIFWQIQRGGQTKQIFIWLFCLPFNSNIF